MFRDEEAELEEAEGAEIFYTEDAEILLKRASLNEFTRRVPLVSS